MIKLQTNKNVLAIARVSRTLEQQNKISSDLLTGVNIRTIQLREVNHYD